MIQISLHLNIAKSYLKRASAEAAKRGYGDGGVCARQAQYHACIGIALSELSAEPNEKMAEKGKVIRANAQLAQGHVGAAARDAARAGDRKTSVSVQKKAVRQRKANRSLAKNIAKWVGEVEVRSSRGETK